jgi:tetratricopeptide (TPR) repeat protein
MTLIVEGGDPMRAYQIASRIAPQEPNSAIAQLGLAFDTAFVLDQLPPDQRRMALAAARRASEQALAIAPEFGDAYVPWCLLHSPVHVGQCEDRLRRALRIDADAPFVTFFLSNQLEAVGRSREALELATMALANDRYKVWKIARVLRTLEAVGLSAEADRLSTQAMRWWPDHPGLIVNRVVGLTERGDLAAIDRLDAQLGPKAFPQWMVVPRGLSAAAAGQDRTRVRRDCARIDPDSMQPVYCMLALAQVGDFDAAYALADPLYPRLGGRNLAEEDQYWLDNLDKPELALLSSRAAAALRHDPRFLAIADRVGLLAYWRSGRLPDFCLHDHEAVCATIESAAR